MTSTTSRPGTSDDIATWDERTTLDRLAVVVYRALSISFRALLVLVAVLILLVQFLLTSLATVDDPVVGVFALLSALPALALVVYVWYIDPGVRERVGLLVATFLLGVLFAGFAAVANTLLRPLFLVGPVVGLVLYFYLVVAPIEEVVKLLAVRLWAYDSEQFDAVIDGAVYGAMAGLGFATIENALYIAQQYLMAVEAGAGILERTVGTTAVRSLAGPGHVIYSALAGYYLGLAKFNREDAGPIVVKGLLIAVFIHATYNTLVSVLPSVLDFTLLTFVGFVVVYDGVFGYLLYRKLARYRSAYEAAPPPPAGEE